MGGNKVQHQSIQIRLGVGYGKNVIKRKGFLT